MTSDEIRAELGVQLKPLFDYGNVRVVFGWPDEPARPGGLRLQTDEAIPLDFTVTREHGNTGFAVFVNRIGDWSVLNALPHKSVIGNYRIPRWVFKPGDRFIFDYHNGEDVIKNYSLYTELCIKLQPKRIFEIGVRAGYSAYCMLRGAPNVQYHGIDLDQGTAGGTVGYTAHAQAMLPQEFPNANICIDYGDSQKLDNLPDSYDLVHVDGDHGHDETLHDLLLASRHANYVLIDDVNHIATVGSAVIDFLQLHSVSAVFYDTWRGHILLDTSSLSTI